LVGGSSPSTPTKSGIAQLAEQATVNRWVVGSSPTVRVKKDKLDTLILNKNWQPDKVVDWKKAMTLLYSSRVEVIEYYKDRTISSGSMEHKLPLVLRHQTGKTKKINLRLTRKALFLRDGGKCQYCSAAVNKATFTIDHVIPKAKKGLTTWNNVVVSCYECNAKKGPRTPEEALMPLVRKPQKPKDKKTLLAFELGEEHKWKNYV